MKITQPVSTNYGSYEHRTAGIQPASGYRIGQILEAIVLSSSARGLVNLRIGNNEVSASSAIPLQQNTRLSLKVTRLQPQLLLQVLPLSDNDPLHNARINLLPRQTSLAPLLAELLFKSQPREATSIPAKLKSADQALMNAVPTRQDLKQADSLQRAIRQSGLFLEAKLAQPASLGPVEFSTDLKAVLLQYLRILSQSQTRPGQAQARPGSCSPPIKPGPAEQNPVQASPKTQGSELPQAQKEHPSGSHLPNTNTATGVHKRQQILTAFQNRTPGIPHNPAHYPSHPTSSADLKTPYAILKAVTADLPPPQRGQLPFSHARAPQVLPPSAQDTILNNSALVNKCQGALARLGLLQIATTENVADGQLLWQLELPVRQDKAVEIVSLTIAREKPETAAGKEQGDTWSVNLSLDLPQLGNVQSRINLDQAGLSIHFWCETPQTLSVIESRLSDLRANVELHGMTAQHFSARMGPQPTTQPSRPDGPLIHYQI